MTDEPTQVQHLAKLLTTAPDGLLVVDANGIIRYANPAAHELFRRPPGSLTGQDFGYPDVADRRDIELVRPDGGLRTVEMRAVSTTWDHETVWVITLRDTTEQRRREAELRAALVTTGELASELTHEVNTPLAVVIGLADTLDHRWDELSDAQRRDLAHRIGRQATRLHRMTRRMLLAGSLDVAPPRAEIEAVNLWEVALAHLSDIGTGSVRIDCPRDLQVLAEPAAVDEIVSNLVENADKYGAPPVEVRAHRLGVAVELRVSDQGPGVPEDFVPHLFDRYSRAAPTLRQKEGVGLGLFLVRRFAQANGGDVRYEPNQPHGACFVVTLPAA
jgi:signal transduction histidine kinase